MSDQITAEFKFSILPEWVLDAKVSDKAVRLYAVLARYADSQTHKAFPSRKTLAERLQCSAASVDRAAQELVEFGAITKQHRHNSSVIYTLRVSSPVQRGVLTSDEGGSSPMMRGVLTDDDLTITTELEPENIEPHKAMSESFNQFWEAYPKKVQKGDARKAFAKAVNLLGDAQQIIEGAERMAADPNLPPKQFIPYPASWLNGEGWEDEPFAPRDPLSIPGVTEGARRSPYVGGPREWVKDLHEQGEHWECREGEFGCR